MSVLKVRFTFRSKRTDDLSLGPGSQFTITSVYVEARSLLEDGLPDHCGISVRPPPRRDTTSVIDLLPNSRKGPGSTHVFMDPRTFVPKGPGKKSLNLGDPDS